MATEQVSLTYNQLIFSLIKWAKDNNHDWHVGWEDEGIVSINFQYLLENDDEHHGEQDGPGTPYGNPEDDDEKD